MSVTEISHAELSDELHALRVRVADLEQALALAEERAAQIERSRQWIDNILESMDGAFIAFDSQWHFTYVNQQAERMLQMTAANLLGRTVQEVFPDRLDSTFYLECRRAMEEQTPVTFDLLSLSQNRWHQIRAFPAENALFVYSMDVTERKQTEMNLQDSQRFVEHVMEVTPDVVFVSNVPGGEITYTNHDLTDILGYHRSETGEFPHIGTLIHPDDIPGQVTAIAVTMTLNNGSVNESEYRIRHRDGTWHWFHSRKVVFNRNPDGSVRQLFGVVQDITKVKEMQEQLATSERQQRSILEAIPDLMFQLNMQGITLNYHAPHEMVLYDAPEHFVGKRISEVLPVDVAETLLPAIARAFQTGLVQTCEYQISLPDGIRFRQARITASDDGTALALVRDITALKNAATVLSQHNEYLTALHDTALGLMNRLNLDDLLESIVSRAGSLLDTQFGSIHLLDAETGNMICRVGIGLGKANTGTIVQHGQGLTALIWDTGESCVVSDYQTWEGHLDTPIVMMLHAALAVPLKSGDKVVGVLSLGRAEENKPFHNDQVALIQQFAALASIALDNAQLYTAAQQELSERKRAESQLLYLNAELEHRVLQRTAELEQERTRLKTVLDTMGEGLIYTQDSRISYANDAFAQMTGFSIAELIGQPISFLKPEQHTGEQLASFDQAFADNGPIWRGEVETRRKNGPTFIGALTISRVFDADYSGIADRSGLGEVIIIRDITAQKKLQAQKLQFITNASHELRTPLTNFTMRLYLLKKQPEELAQHVATLERIINRMSGLVEDLLDVSRFERGLITLRTRDIVLQDVINEAVSLQMPDTSRKEIAFDAAVPAEPLHVIGDMNRLIQVMLNLIANSINYTPVGGRISINLITEAQAGQQYAVIRVTDTGTGIAPEFLPQVFEPFFRVNETVAGGTGLGLSITKEIVELHGGEISVDSELGVGSVFKIRLPLSPPSSLAVS